MISKLLLVGALAAAAASTGVTVHHMQTPQGPDARVPSLDDERVDLRAELDALRDEVARLARCAREAKERVARAEDRLGDVEQDLEDAFELAAQGSRRGHGRNCTPSRSRLLTYNRTRRRDPVRASDLARRMIRELGSNGALNSCAWELLTEDEFAGRYDALALEMTDAMQRRGGLTHYMVDTVALAKFRNGHVDEAVELQERAIAMGGDDDDYVERLETYRAAQRSARRVATKRID